MPSGPGQECASTCLIDVRKEVGVMSRMREVSRRLRIEARVVAAAEGWSDVGRKTWEKKLVVMRVRSAGADVRQLLSSSKRVEGLCEEWGSEIAEVGFGDERKGVPSWRESSSILE